MSSGVVSLRTSSTGPLSAISTASSAENATRPTAAPGDAEMPVVSLTSSLSVFGSKTGCSKLIELSGRDAHDGFLLRDHAFFDHVDRDANGGRTGALAIAGLKHVELPFLNGELEILHVLVMLFEIGGDFDELLEGFGHDDF